MSQLTPCDIDSVIKDVELTIKHAGRIVRRNKKKINTEELGKLSQLVNGYSRLISAITHKDEEDDPLYYERMEEEGLAKLRRMRGGD